MAKSTKRKVRRNVVRGIVHIKATFNNTLVTVSDPDGGVICQDSGGSVGFKGSRKSTPYAAQMAGEKAGKDAVERFKMKNVQVKVKGPGPGRESAIRALNAAGLNIVSIEDTTGIPHNGCRAKKKRRV